MRRAHAAGQCRAAVINTTYRRAPWADLLYGADGRWWDSVDGAADFGGLKVTQDAAAAARWGLHRVPLAECKQDPMIKPGLSLDPWFINSGMNSGYQLLGLTLHLAGPGRRLLLGYDMKFGPGGEVHWHGRHGDKLHNPDQGRFTAWSAQFATVIPDLARAGMEVVNVTPDSALDCFPRGRLSDYL